MSGSTRTGDAASSGRRVVMQIAGLVGGGASPFDGQFLVEYDPDREGVAPDGTPMLAHVTTTPELALARRFESGMEALEEWRRASERWPTRPDGRPNRPLTAFTVEIAAPDKFT